jgi:hypothetical protein
MDLDERKKRYEIDAQRIYTVHEILRKKFARERLDTSLADAWATNAEEIVAVRYDIDRMTALASECVENVALRGYYEETVERLKRRLVKLEEVRPAIEENANEALALLASMQASGIEP